jgi:23S rRNA pseudouridine1911/1915/1917 synthase
MPGWSRSRLARLIEAGGVRIHGETVVASRRLKPGERVLLDIPDPQPSALTPHDIPLTILHEDEDLVVVDKPAGLSVHPGAGAPGPTLVSALLHHVGERLRGVGGELRPGIVHRLDKGTTGVMVVAKSAEAHANLAAQFARRAVSKEYLAIVLGVPAPEGVVDAAIARSRTVRTRMATAARGGRSARTTWKVLETFGGQAALLSVRIETGRTHQIRVHLASIGHAVAGDALYGGARIKNLPPGRIRALLGAFTRPALHAHGLSFEHPSGHERMEVEAPLPRDMAELLTRLRAASVP